MPHRPHRTARLACAAALALAAGATGAHAQTDPRAHYRSLSPAEVRAIEYDLIWAGATDAVTNGRIGRGDVASIRNFEAEMGLRADGVLRPRERRVLARLARNARERVGYEVVRDAVTGARLGLPRGLLGPSEPVGTGQRWISPDGNVRVRTRRRTGDLEAIYRRQVERDGRNVTYDVLRDDWFVVATEGPRRDAYLRAETDGGEVRSFSIAYTDAVADLIEPLIVAMSNDFEPFPAGRPGPAARREPRPERLLSDELAVASLDGPCGQSYRVRPGDTLFAVALRCAVSVPALRRANRDVDPRALRVGQVLRVPAEGGAFPPPPAPPGSERFEERFDDRFVERFERSGEPRIALRSPDVVVSGAVEIEAAGFAPNQRIELGFARSDRRMRVTRLAQADGRGRLSIALSVPEGLRPGDTAMVGLFVPGGRSVVLSDPFTVRAPAPPPPPRQPLSVAGMLTSEGERCMAMRDVDGRLLTLAGPLGGFTHGAPVQVEALEATPQHKELCAQGQTIEVQTIRRR